LRPDDFSRPAAAQNAGIAAPGGLTVAMDGTSFAPAQQRVKVGDTITWINNDPFPHNVAAAAQPSLHSGDLQPGERWTFTPTRAGRIEYECTLHPGMRGTLIVE
jgi:plastocyanin